MKSLEGEMHECDCEYCEEEMIKCPYCDCEDFKYFNDGTVQCENCETMLYQNNYEKDRDLEIVKKFES